MTRFDPPVARRAVVLAAILSTLAFLITCGERAENAAPPKPEPTVVEAPDLDLRLSVDPTKFVVVDTSPPSLETADPADPGRIAVDARPAEYGQNLPAAVAEHQQELAERDGGTALGAQELVSPLGTAFYSRGRFTSDGKEVEETAVFALHPAGGRMITLTYRYPAGNDSSDRVEQLFEVLGTVEAM